MRPRHWTTFLLRPGGRARARFSLFYFGRVLREEVKLMKLNQKCGRPRGDAGLDDFSPGALLSDELGALLAEGFTTLNGAIVFKAMRQTAKRIKPENFSDLTGFECFINQVHVEDHLHGTILDQTALLKEGVAFTLAVQSRLHSCFADKPFTVQLASTDTTCAGRFHVTRPTEQWLSSDLDGYAEEAILVLEDQ
jgi:hypothetical protein